MGPPPLDPKARDWQGHCDCSNYSCTMGVIRRQAELHWMSKMYFLALLACLPQSECKFLLLVSFCIWIKSISRCVDSRLKKVHSLRKQGLTFSSRLFAFNKSIKVDSVVHKIVQSSEKWLWGWFHLGPGCRSSASRVRWHALLDLTFCLIACSSLTLRQQRLRRRSRARNMNGCTLLALLPKMEEKVMHTLFNRMSK